MKTMQKKRISARKFLDALKKLSDEQRDCLYWMIKGAEIINKPHIPNNKESLLKNS